MKRADAAWVAIRALRCWMNGIVATTSRMCWWWMRDALLRIRRSRSRTPSWLFRTGRRITWLRNFGRETFRGSMKEHGIGRRQTLKYLGMLTGTVAGREFLAFWLPANTAAREPAAHEH